MRVTGILLGLLFSALSCREAPWDNEVPLEGECQAYDGWPRVAYLREVPGTLVLVSDSLQTRTQLCIQVNDTLRYAACNLPTQVQTIGKTILFNGDELARPADTPMVAIPMRLTRLRTMP